MSFAFLRALKTYGGALLLSGSLILIGHHLPNSAVTPLKAAPSAQTIPADPSGSTLFPQASPLALAGESRAVPPSSSVICTPGRLWRWRESCSEQGPGATAYRVAHIRLPDPLPELPLIPFENDPDEDVVPHTFAEVQTLPLSIYRHPLEASMGLPPVRILYSGDQWVSVENQVEYEGQLWTQINEGEFVPADALVIANPSRFQGVSLSQHPSYPFGWVVRTVQPARAPQGAPNADAPYYYRYEVVTIYAQESWGGRQWYLVGPEQWIEQIYLSVVTPESPPAEIPAGVPWIEVDLYEQTLAAYEGERMVYATLISSGRPGETWTDSGIFRVWGKYLSRKMSNPDAVDGDPDWYYLEDVVWTTYFNDSTAFHTSYWHDAFGYTQSHGCVNLAPRDAEWIYYWTTPFASPNAEMVHASGNGTWVWVHNSPYDP